MHDSGFRRRVAALAASLLLAVSCAGATARPDGDTAALWGFVRLVPRDGVTPPRAGGGAYGDRRLRDVTLVDYDRPGFAVVWAEGEPAGGGAARDVALALSDGPSGVRIDPEHAAVASGARVVLRNDTRSAHTVSCPEAGLLRRLAPGESALLRGEPGSELGVFLLGEGRAESRVFVAPGAFAVAREDGRWELRGLRPGPQRLHAWHPRYPSAVRSAEAVRGAATRVDLQLGVDRGEEAADARR